MEYAVVLISGKQFRVSYGQVIEVAKIDGEKGREIILDKVLLFHSESATQIGQPYLENFSVKAEILDQFKGTKIDVHKYKSKVRYRRKMGFRPILTKIKITSIGDKKASRPIESKKEVVVKKKTIMAKIVKKAKRIVKKTK